MVIGLLGVHRISLHVEKSPRGSALTGIAHATIPAVIVGCGGLEGGEGPWFCHGF